MKNYFRLFIDYLFLMRLFLLVPVWTVFLFGYYYGALFSGNNISPFFNKEFFFNIIFFSLAVSSYYIFNQLNDIETDKLNKKLFLISENVVPKSHAIILSILLFSISNLYALYMGIFYSRWDIVLVFFMASFFGVTYNLPPFLWKNKPILGLLADSLGHGLVTFLAGWISITHISKEAFIYSLPMTFGNAAIFLLTTIVDEQGDRKAGKITFVVKYGKDITIKVSILFMLLAFLSIFLMRSDIIEKSCPFIIGVLGSLLVYLYLLRDDNKKIIFIAFKTSVAFVTISLFFYYKWYLIVVLFTYLISKIYYKYRFNKNYPSLTGE